MRNLLSVFVAPLVLGSGSAFAADQKHEFPKEMVYKFEKQFEPRVDKFSEILGSIVRRFDMQILPPKGTFEVLPVHVAAFDKKMDQQIFVFVGAAVEKRFAHNEYRVDDLSVYHLSAQGVPFAIGFRGMKSEDVLHVINRLKVASLNASDFRVPSWLINQAHADDVADPGAAPTATAEEPSIAAKLADSFGGCAQGLSDGVYMVTIDPIVKFGEGVVFTVKEPRQMWRNTVYRAEVIKGAVVGFAKAPIESMRSGLKSFGNKSIGERNRSLCSLVGGGGATSYMMKTVKTAGALGRPAGLATAAAPASMVENEALALTNAKKLGFNVGNRQAVLDAIDQDLARFAKEPRGFVADALQYQKDVAGEMIAAIDKSFKSSAARGTAAYATELEAHRLQALQSIRNSGNTDLIQVLRLNVEKTYGWDSFYNAYFSRTVSNGKDTLSAGAQTNLAFKPGPDRGAVEVYGYSWESDPMKVLQANSSTPLKVENLVVQQARRNEGISAYPLRFTATIVPE